MFHGKLCVVAVSALIFISQIQTITTSNVFSNIWANPQQCLTNHGSDKPQRAATRGTCSVASYPINSQVRGHQCYQGNSLPGVNQYPMCQPHNADPPFHPFGYPMRYPQGYIPGYLTYGNYFHDPNSSSEDSSDDPPDDPPCDPPYDPSDDPPYDPQIYDPSVDPQIYDPSVDPSEDPGIVIPVAPFDISPTVASLVSMVPAAVKGIKAWKAMKGMLAPSSGNGNLPVSNSSQANSNGNLRAASSSGSSIFPIGDHSQAINTNYTPFRKSPFQIIFKPEGKGLSSFRSVENLRSFEPYNHPDGVKSSVEVYNSIHQRTKDRPNPFIVFTPKKLTKAKLSDSDIESYITAEEMEALYKDIISENKMLKVLLFPNLSLNEAEIQDIVDRISLRILKGKSNLCTKHEAINPVGSSHTPTNPEITCPPYKTTSTVNGSDIIHKTFPPHDSKSISSSFTDNSRKPYNITHPPQTPSSPICFNTSPSPHHPPPCDPIPQSPQINKPHLSDSCPSTVSALLKHFASQSSISSDSVAPENQSNMLNDKTPKIEEYHCHQPGIKTENHNLNSTPVGQHPLLHDNANPARICNCYSNSINTGPIDSSSFLKSMNSSLDSRINPIINSKNDPTTICQDQKPLTTESFSNILKLVIEHLSKFQDQCCLENNNKSSICVENKVPKESITVLSSCPEKTIFDSSNGITEKAQSSESTGSISLSDGCNIGQKIESKTSVIALKDNTGKNIEKYSGSQHLKTDVSQKLPDSTFLKVEDNPLIDDKKCKCPKIMTNVISQNCEKTPAITESTEEQVHLNSSSVHIISQSDLGSKIVLEKGSIKSSVLQEQELKDCCSHETKSITDPHHSNCPGLEMNTNTEIKQIPEIHGVNCPINDENPSSDCRDTVCMKVQKILSSLRKCNEEASIAQTANSINSPSLPRTDTDINMNEPNLLNGDEPTPIEDCAHQPEPKVIQPPKIHNSSCIAENENSSTHDKSVCHTGDIAPSPQSSNIIPNITASSTLTECRGNMQNSIEENEKEKCQCDRKELLTKIIKEVFINNLDLLSEKKEKSCVPCNNDLKVAD